MSNKQKRVHYFQHVPFEGLGSIEAWLEDNGHAITHTRFYEPVLLPEIAELDLLVVMGGPMSVNDEALYPWLVEEKSYIREAIGAGKPVLGICLGAQLIASALGARVYPNRDKEIGWFPIYATGEKKARTFSFPPEILVFHWHGETFDLPPGAIRLAGSEGCRNQAFQVGHSVIGLQFHLETTQESAKAIVANCGEELVEAQYVQSKEEILSVQPQIHAGINTLMGDILCYLLDA